MIELIPLSPEEISVSAMPEDEANDEHQNNPHLVARIVRWHEHDLSYKPTFDTLVGGLHGWKDSLRERILALAPADAAVELPDEKFLNRYEKAWYNLLYAAYGMVNIVRPGAGAQAVAPPITFGNFHTALIDVITRLVAFNSREWQDYVVRGFLANREICLNHDSSIAGRLCYYTDKKEQNLYAPLFVGNM
jgi:hypothetical protein